MKNNLISFSGFSLVQAMVGGSLMAGVALGLASLFSDAAKNASALEQKVAAMETKSLLSSLLTSVPYCKCVFSSARFNPTTLTWTTPLTKIDSAFSSTCAPAGTPHLETGKSLFGTKLIVESIKVENNFEIVAGVGDFLGMIRVKLDAGNGRRAVKDMILPIRFRLSTAGSGPDYAIDSCQSATGSGLTTGLPQPTVLGYGKVASSGTGNVLCFPISFQPGWDQSKIITSGNHFYNPAGTGSWGHWTIFFTEINAASGTANVCMDSGGWSGTVGAEQISWIVYGLP